MRLSSILAIPAAMLLLAQTAFASNWDLDASHTQVGFSVRHMTVSNTHGKFNKITGTVALDDKDDTKSVVNIDIDVASIDTDDAKRDEHLRSADFFDAKKFPKMTFKSTKVAKQGENLLVTGDLTIRGVTKSVVLTTSALSPEVKDPWGGTRRGTSATTKINRKDFGIGASTPGVVVGEEISIQLDIELVKKK